ncbi:phosphate/phosphite/phosphonate ABC transporter substrate-binding protein [Bradyrhizobium sp. AUGA SZCCT0431]|uniref:phosphate/phosphite/phosphonate ABC transporter substrate-binding protein n=1 Tax=Bradyrhizobium sp. AUGA SZCCT0431 TaxID=2807674 RepID=UPI001BAB7042|nr:phosphate/phosphite/phosphonate ABC transporter substrate-binding protein [Bradyrhizobium sp. AUGA SZCCT0431]MBR1146156.1 phosphate/phosphite/phosphonate ABC transporter substrate-binding protein [Bradyrhizobium sp. AUGA SZCCT0431]
MFKAVKWIVASAMAVSVASAAVCDDIKELKIGLLPIPAESPEALAQSFQNMADNLGKRLGVPAKIFVSPSFNALIESLASKRLDMAFFGAEGYVAMKEQGMQVVPIAKAIHFGRVHYKSSIIVRADSGINSVADLKGKTFAFVAPTSTSGGLAPLYMLHQNGVATADLKRILYTGNQEASMLAVKNGKVDAAAVADHYWEYWKKAGLISFDSYDDKSDKIVNGDLKIIAAMSVPEMPMVVRSDLDKDSIEKLKSGLLSLPEGTLGKTGFAGDISGFAPTADSDYTIVEDMKKIGAKNSAKK